MAEQTPESQEQVQADRDVSAAPDHGPAAARQDHATPAGGGGGTESGGGGNPGEPGARPVDLPDFEGGNGQSGTAALSLLNDVSLKVRVELGRTRMYVEDVLRLNENSVVELDKAAGDPVDIYVNDRHIARGEVLVLDDNFCVRISEILESPDP